MNISNKVHFYVPGESKDWQNIDLSFILDGEQEKDLLTGQKEYPQLGFGFCDHNNLNENMKNLLDTYEVSNESTSELLKIIRNKMQMEEEHEEIRYGEVVPAALNLGFGDHLAVQAIFEIFYCGRKTEFVCRKLNIEKHDLRRLCRIYRKNLKDMKKANRRFLNKRRKIECDQLGTIRQFCQEKRFHNYTLNDLNLHLQKQTEGELIISNSTLGRVLKSKIDMTYKKVNKIHPKILTNEGKRKMLEAAVLQLRLFQNEIEVVYIDEFKFSCHKSNSYGWTKRGRSGYFKCIPETFQASFMVAFSKMKIHGIIATVKTFNSVIFKCFLSNLASSIKTEYAIVCDNSKVHTSKSVKDYVSQHKINLITIPAYCPFVNPCEKLILNVKSKVRKSQRKGCLISLMTFKKYIDEIKRIELEGCIKSSFEEVINLAT